MPTFSVVRPPRNAVIPALYAEKHGKCVHPVQRRRRQTNSDDCRVVVARYPIIYVCAHDKYGGYDNFQLYAIRTRYLGRYCRPSALEAYADAIYNMTNAVERLPFSIVRPPRFDFSSIIVVFSYEPYKSKRMFFLFNQIQKNYVFSLYSPFAPFLLFSYIDFLSTCFIVR